MQMSSSIPTGNSRTRSTFAVIYDVRASWWFFLLNHLTHSHISLIAMTIRLAHAQLATLLLLLATVVPATATATATGPGWSSEADALLAWKASLLDSAALSSWTQGVSTCAWDGVICGQDNRVHTSTVAIKAFFSSLTPRLFPRSYRQVDPCKEKFDEFFFFPWVFTKSTHPKLPVSPFNHLPS
jgi:hypothetical protein